MSTLFITGANRGLGLEFAKQFLDLGWEVLATARNPEKSQDLQELAKEKGDQISLLQLDLRDFQKIESLAQKLEGKKIDLLLSNGAVYGGKQAFGDMDYENWKEVFVVNTMAPLKLAEAFLPHVERGEKKWMVFVTSKMGSIADNQSGGNYIYRSTKAALNMVCKSLSIDLKPKGITAIVIHPGWVKTDMGGEHAPLTPKESISGMIQVIQNLSIEKTGRFYNYDGTQLPW